MKKTRIALGVDFKELEALKVISAKTDAPVSALIRRAIIEYLKNQKRKG